MTPPGNASADPGVNATAPSRGRAWLQLVRLPSLFSAWGDPVAGACLAGALASPGRGHQLIVAAASALSVYAAGLIDNDLADLAEDRRDRPDRPLAAAAIGVAAARRGRLLLFALPYLLGMACRMPPAWVGLHVLLLLTVLGYNRLKGRSVLLGAVLMGLCRALSLAGGMVLAGPGGESTVGLLAALLPWWGYIGGISLFAEHETSRVPGPQRYLLLLPPLAWLIGARFSALPGPAAWAVTAAGGTALVLVLDVLVRLRDGAAAQVVPPAVGRLIRILILVQALCAMAAPPRYGVVLAGVLVLCWALSEKVGRRFYAS